MGTNAPLSQWTRAGLLRDLLDAVVEDRRPISSGEDGTKALELVMAVWESHRQHIPVSLPLARRDHPLEAWLADAGLPVPAAPELVGATR